MGLSVSKANNLPKKLDLNDDENDDGRDVDSNCFSRSDSARISAFLASLKSDGSVSNSRKRPRCMGQPPYASLPAVNDIRDIFDVRVLPAEVLAAVIDRDSLRSARGGKKRG